MLRCHARKHFGEFTLDVALAAPDRSRLVLVGESGAGKTTVLRLLAGLEVPDEGRIEIDGRVLDDAGTHVAPAARQIGYVPQEYALFPHLSVFDNVAFGLRATRRPEREVRRDTLAALERWGLVALAERRPRELSGGQRQRTALARALVLEPRLLLLDEPLSALDLAARREIRRELRAQLADRGCIVVYVTHSPSEALAFGDRIAVLEDGRVAQEGTAEDLLRRPRSAFVAAFLGVNHLRGVAGARRGERVEMAIESGSILLDPGAEALAPGEEIVLALPPERVTLSAAPLAGENVLAGAVAEIVPQPPAGERVRVTLATTPPLVAELPRERWVALGLQPEAVAYASFDASAARVVR